ncbi:DUF7521 family protein [Haloferacaceae archaeon DSL9]
MRALSIALVVIQTTILILGGSITYFAHKAYRRTRDPALRALAIGFGLVTAGALLGGIIHQVFNVTLTAGVVVSSFLMACGFAVITYSLFLE